MEYEADHLRSNRYAVRPKGCLGTCGWKDGVAWDVVYVNASSEFEAILKAHNKRLRAYQKRALKKSLD